MKRPPGCAGRAAPRARPAASRRRITDAAGRGSVTAPRVELLPGPGGRRHDGTLNLRPHERDPTAPAVDLRVLRVHLRPCRGRPRRRHPARAPRSRTSRTLVLPRVRGAQEGLRARTSDRGVAKDTKAKVSPKRQARRCPSRQAGDGAAAADEPRAAQRRARDARAAPRGGHGSASFRLRRRSTASTGARLCYGEPIRDDGPPARTVIPVARVRASGGAGWGRGPVDQGGGGGGGGTLDALPVRLHRDLSGGHPLHRHRGSRGPQPHAQGGEHGLC